MTNIKTRLQNSGQAVLNGGIAAFIFNLFLGRCTFAAVVFSIIGVYGWLHGRDLTSYAVFVTSIQGLLVVHSIKEDLFEYKHRQLDQQQSTPPAQS